MKTVLAVALVALISNEVLADAEFLAHPTGANNPEPADPGAYVIDDGTGERNIGFNGAGTMVWLNRFNVSGGPNLIESVAIAGGIIPAGLPVTILIFGDPNNDGAPFDIGPDDLLYSAVELTGEMDSDAFAHYEVVPGVLLGLGDMFYVGACIDQAAGDRPARQDVSSGSLHRSWVAGGFSGDCSDPNAMEIPIRLIDTFNFPGNWMVRAFGSFVDCFPECDAGGPYAGGPGEAIQFDGTGSSPQDSFDWDFGDGHTGTGPLPTHAYGAEGLYTVVLRINEASPICEASCLTTAKIEGATAVNPASWGRIKRQYR